MEPHSMPLVLFDRDCGFCTRAASFMTGPWVRADVASTPLQNIDLTAHGLTVDKCLETLHVVDGESVFTGSAAIARVLRAGRLPWPLVGAVLVAPGVRRLGRGVYALVARNRHRLPGGTSSCERQ